MKKYITFSFDDGSQDDIDVINNYLEPNKIPATFYLIAGRLDSADKIKSHYSSLSKNKRSVQNLRDDLFSILFKVKDNEIGCHGFQHLDMSKKDFYHDMYKESYEAKRILEEYLHQYRRSEKGWNCSQICIKAYAFPYGLTSERFYKFLVKNNIFKTHRLFKTAYDFVLSRTEFFYPDFFTNQLSIVLNQIELGTSKNFIHIAGHSDAILDYKQDFFDNFITMAETKGYEFVNNTRFYKEQE